MTDGINERFESMDGVVTVTSNYVAQSSDRLIIVDNGSAAVSVTIAPESSVPIELYRGITIMKLGAGAVTVIRGRTVTFSGASGDVASLTFVGAHGYPIFLRKIASDTWEYTGFYTGNVSYNSYIDNYIQSEIPDLRFELLQTNYNTYTAKHEVRTANAFNVIIMNNSTNDLEVEFSNLFYVGMQVGCWGYIWKTGTGEITITRRVGVGIVFVTALGDVNFKIDGVAPYQIRWEYIDTDKFQFTGNIKPL